MRLVLIVFVCLAIVGYFQVDGAKKKKRKKPLRTCNSRVCLKVHGKSGAFSITRGHRNESDPKKITMAFVSIKEKDINGKIIGSRGPKAGRHSFNNFAALDFEFSEEENVTYEGINATRFNFSTTIPGPNAVLNVPIYLFDGEGSLDVCGDEEVDILPGVMKYNIELSNWDFCKNLECSQSGSKKKRWGKYVDLVMSVRKKGKAYRGKKWRRGKKKGGKPWKKPTTKKWKSGKGKGKGKKRNKVQKFFFGNASIAFPDLYEADGMCAEMPEGYPILRMKKKGIEHNIVFRFPKFNNTIKYDPAISIKDTPGEPANDTINGTAIPPMVNGTKVPTTCCSSYTLLPSQFGLVIVLSFFLFFLS